MSEFKEKEPLLKDDLVCWRCGRVMKNMPTLKSHLQDEWDKESKTEKAKLERKRKREEIAEQSAEAGAGSAKRRAPDMEPDANETTAQ